MKKITLICIISLILTGCGNKKTARQEPEVADSETMYFAGDFTYFADAAIFRDCATGVTMNVEMNEVFKEVQKKYMALKPEPRESVSLDVEGYIISRTEGEEGHPVRLVMTRFIEMDNTLECDEAAMKTGRYVRGGDTIAIDADYTYLKAGGRGKWGLLDMGEMFLIENADTVFMHVDMWSGDLIANDTTRYVKQN